MGSHQTITNALARIRPRTHRRVHRTGLSTHQYGNVTATNKLTANQPNLSRLGHGVGRLNGRNQTAGFDHAQCNTCYIICHITLRLFQMVKKK